MPAFSPSLALVRHVRSKVFHFEEFSHLLRQNRNISINAFMYCVHRLNQYGALSFGFANRRNLDTFFSTVKRLWPEMSLLQRFEVAISLAKIHQRQHDADIYAFLHEFLRAARLETCYNYTFNQVMHLAIIAADKRTFYLCLGLIATADAGRVLTASKLALAKNLAKFTANERGEETAAVFARFVLEMDLEKLPVQELLGLFFSVGVLRRCFPEEPVYARFAARLDRRILRWRPVISFVRTVSFSKLMQANSVVRAQFVSQWTKAVLKSPPGLSRSATLRSIALQTTPSTLCCGLLAFFVLEQTETTGTHDRAICRQLREAALTIEHRYLLELFPQSSFASLVERLAAMAGKSELQDQTWV